MNSSNGQMSDKGYNRSYQFQLQFVMVQHKVIFSRNFPDKRTQDKTDSICNSSSGLVSPLPDNDMFEETAFYFLLVNVWRTLRCTWSCNKPTFMSPRMSNVIHGAITVQRWRQFIPIYCQRVIFVINSINTRISDCNEVSKIWWLTVNYW